ncbi:MAG: tRNA (N6-threonylcarbamoyladenosine(37)-N6)-methyltransferase TrmO [Ignavibacteria bacterium GWB2_35_12]|nr:MAG: tRNA (N6-threonylcarbamoyladenosine(37)-N6)-methyltransferase TrmO [Ignavibacteria bacterium GWA2_35_8]OGU38035.1 MAG: tRNA (N6-threonylcarbamoyladenosine(37)-N6)-methyltransferase TrmO [Ignavibacteria bacterium GWB2_35_12]OGU87497.1 MAG: tRNA (N6-threonylcarbamoyladenosine(37)-N6)-methyltransferase TrmO [Ignavibacteria bacterium RIFOXYA2_FULL_35_10]OGV25043.1 MAG: tRNA (N6-threonylcarbamoyladenosine(37)-N6)-methyltransferase TrmO [Ignavibacteria bacterium RIFOXYC2_FULL_35_21]
MDIIFKPIGTIYSPFEETTGVPIQPSAAIGIRGRIVIFDEFIEGLKDLDGFSHITLIYHLHLIKTFSLHVIPFVDKVERGVFSTRAPARPNPIGLSVVRLIEVKDNNVIIENVDIVNGTPLLDIKPYVPGCENYDNEYKIGWLTENINKLNEMKSDGRF